METNAVNKIENLLNKEYFEIEVNIDDCVYNEFKKGELVFFRYKDNQHQGVIIDKFKINNKQFIKLESCTFKEG